MTKPTEEQGQFLFALQSTSETETTLIVHGAPPYAPGLVIRATQRGAKLVPGIDWDHYLSEAHLYAEEVEAKNAEATALERD